MTELTVPLYGKTKTERVLEGKVTDGKVTTTKGPKLEGESKERE